MARELGMDARISKNCERRAGKLEQHFVDRGNRSAIVEVAHQCDEARCNEKSRTWNEGLRELVGVRKREKTQNPEIKEREEDQRVADNGNLILRQTSCFGPVDESPPRCNFYVIQK